MGFLIFVSFMLIMCALAYRYRDIWLSPIRNMPSGNYRPDKPISPHKRGELSKDEIANFQWDLAHTDKPIEQLYRETNRGNGDDGMSMV